MYFSSVLISKINRDLFLCFCMTLFTFLSNICRDVNAANKTSIIMNVFQGKACRVVIEYAEVVRAIPEYEVKVIEIVKYNKSLPVLNLEFVVHDQKFMGYKLWVDGYQKYGMEHIYKRSAMSLHTFFCDTISGNFFFTNSLQNFTNFPHKCPLKVGQLYYLRNFYLDEKATPLTFPGYKWRFDVQIGPEGSRDTNRAALMRFFIRIEWFNRAERIQRPSQKQ